MEAFNNNDSFIDEFSDHLSDNEWQALSEHMTRDNTINWLQGFEYKNSCPLTHLDFFTYFAWEDFQQRNIWDCRILAAMDSLVSYWNYENLIMENVKKCDDGFFINLPLWSPIPHLFFVSFDEIHKNQINVVWNESILVKWKDWIKALILAYWKMSTWKATQFDHQNLRWWSGDYFFYDMIYWINTYYESRLSNNKSEDDDPDWTLDTEFVNNLRRVLENFNPESDMLTLWVYQLQESDLDRLNLSWEAYSSLGHYSKTNHEVSVEKVRKNSDWTIIITISNPWNSNKSYDISFNNLLKSCGDFSLWTKNKKPFLHESKRSNHWKRTHRAADQVNSVNDIRSVNQIVQITWEANDALRESRKDIIVNNRGGVLEVSSFDLNINVQERGWSIVISKGSNDLLINKSNLSKKYEYAGKVIENENYPLYLYWVKIANFINMMSKLYIDSCKWDKNNNKPFCLIDWSLQFDDDPNAFEWWDKVKRKWKSVIWDDYIECLNSNNWNSLWISSWDHDTQQRIVDFLNQLIDYRKHVKHTW